MAKHEKDPVFTYTFDLEAFASHVAPGLWSAVTKLTQSCNKKIEQNQSDSHVHERSVCDFILYNWWPFFCPTAHSPD